MNILRDMLFFLVRTLLVLFPLGTVWLVSVPVVHGSVWEFGVEKIYATELLIGCMAICVCAIAYTKRKTFSVLHTDKKKRLLFPGIVLVLGLVSVYLSDSATLGSQAFRGIESCLIAYVVVSIVVKRDPNALRYLLVGAVPVLLLGLWQWGVQSSPSSVILGLAPHSPEVTGASVVVEEFGGRFLRAYGPFAHPNIFGGYATALLILLLVYQKKNRLDAALVSLLLPLGAAALLVSWSRSAFLGFVCALAVLFFRKQLSLKRCIPIMTVFLVGCCLYSSIFFTRATVASQAEARSITERATGITSAIEGLTWYRPFGVGLGNYTTYLHYRWPSWPGYLLQPVHNTPLLVLVEIGWLGCLFFIAACALFRRKEIVSWGISCLPLLAGFLPALFFDHYLWSTYQGMLFFCIFLAAFPIKGDTSVVNLKNHSFKIRLYRDKK